MQKLRLSGDARIKVREILSSLRVPSELNFRNSQGLPPPQITIQGTDVIPIKGMALTSLQSLCSQAGRRKMRQPMGENVKSIWHAQFKLFEQE